jgi:hypothetical protein
MSEEKETNIDDLVSFVLTNLSEKLYLEISKNKKIKHLSNEIKLSVLINALTELISFDLLFNIKDDANSKKGAKEFAKLCLENSLEKHLREEKE